jgi:hypothetical protein
VPDLTNRRLCDIKDNSLCGFCSKRDPSGPVTKRDQGQVAGDATTLIYYDIQCSYGCQGVCPTNVAIFERFSE